LSFSFAFSPFSLMSSSTRSVVETYTRLPDEISKCPKPKKEDGMKVFSYGTAGFRGAAEHLSSTLHRMGMLAVLRSRQTEKIIGVMVTASHNPIGDNGVKIIDGNGEMLTSSWECHANALANATETDEVVEVLDSIIASEKIDMDRTGNIFLGKDTRPSSENLSELVREGALLIGGNVLDFGLQTTPQLHHLVRLWNYEAYNKGDWASETGYYHMLLDGYKQLTSSVESTILQARGALIVDGAHGVGAIQMKKMIKECSEEVNLNVMIRNTPTDGDVNESCGAEHCQKARLPPKGFHGEADRQKRLCSLDGDADRIVFHYFDTQGLWHLLDGDKIAALFANFFYERLQKIQPFDSSTPTMTLGVVQTAYANGASTAYLKQTLGVDVAMVKTGVKHCHQKASEYDIGIYFEANGHGTVIFKDDCVERLTKLQNSIHDEAAKIAISQLLAAYQVINQSVGDAISDALMVEACLALKGWSIQNWDAKLYADLPSRQTKVQVSDRSLLKCNESETQLIEPTALQEQLTALMGDVADGRVFARPSGTENVVRIYAEAASAEEADALALKAAQAVYELAGGVGDAPTSFVA